MASGKPVAWRGGGDRLKEALAPGYRDADARAVRSDVLRKGANVCVFGFGYAESFGTHEEKYGP